MCLQGKNSFVSIFIKSKLGMFPMCPYQLCTETTFQPIQEPAKTLIQATEGWPLLQYLCMANCVRSSWLEVEDIGILPEVPGSESGGSHQQKVYIRTQQYRYILSINILCNIFRVYQQSIYLYIY